ncbi:ATP-binding protein [Aeromonas sp. QDB05]|uniref:ATP-binding protein n=1 Tax=Aeromonas sp. QDB05 TaxID=2990478 RepID=UPI0022E6ADA3|nr:ATP-binding protein [Aeromonas sp. QDB05]
MDEKQTKYAPALGSKWYDLFNDPTIADAILDRIVHRAHVIELKGESIRKLKAKGV